MTKYTTRTHDKGEEEEEEVNMYYKNDTMFWLAKSMRAIVMHKQVACGLWMAI